MIKQLVSKDIKKYLETGATKILLDVRTKGEWDTVGKPDGDKIGLKTYFLEIRRSAFFNFLQQFKDLKIDQNKEILVICLIIIFFIFLNRIKLYLRNLFDV